MKIKELINYILPFIIGFLILGIIFDILSNIGILLYWFLLKPEHIFFSKTFKWITSIASVLTMIVGGVLGVNAYKKKNQYFEIFKLSKQTLIINLIVVLSINVIGYFMKPFPFDYRIISGSIIWYIIFYPFSAILNHLIYNFKRTNKKALLIILLVITNPIFLMYSTTFNIILAKVPEVLQEECGVIIQGLDESTVFADSRVIGKQINSVNGIEVLGVNDLAIKLDKIESDDEVEFVIGEKKYSLKPYYDTERQKYFFGFYPMPLMCNVTS